MIGDPVALTIRRTIERPPKALVASFADAPTSFIADAQNGHGVLDFRIKPIGQAARFAGPAVTARGGPRDLLAAMAVLDVAAAGDVVVIATGADRSCATIGDHYAALARLRGIAALVTDGLARDRAGIDETGLPTFAWGTVPNSGFNNGPGEVNLPIALGAVAVAPGDIVVGDADGVVVIAREQAADVARQLETVKTREAAAEARIAKGELGRLWDPEKYETRGVRYLD